MRPTRVFGIDHQHTLTVAGLWEGIGASSRFRLIGDGNGMIQHGTAIGDLGDGPWLKEPLAGEFWRSLYGRLRDHIGRTEPVRRDGYEVVVALQAGDHGQACNAVGPLCRAAGFSEAVFWRASDALLARWLAEATPSSAGRTQAVATIALVDTSVQVSGYLVHHGQHLGERTRVDAWELPGHLSGTSHMIWSRELIAMIGQRVHEDLTPLDEAALQVGVLEFATRLWEIDADVAVPWMGLHRERMDSLELSVQQCEGWPSVAILRTDLRRWLSAAQTAVGASAERLDVIVLGGVGARWPFAYNVAREFEPRAALWRSPRPEEDLARGAAMLTKMAINWNRVSAPAPTLAVQSSVADQAATASNWGVRPAQMERGSIPPWERDSLDAVKAEGEPTKD